MDKHYDHVSAEKKITEKWLSQKTYSHSNHPGKLFSIDTPPPTVSGALHIGHIFSYTQTDFIARFARMNGYSVFYPFGFDDNGLPTERFVEKKFGVSAHKIGRSAFIKQCLDASRQAQEEFTTLWQKMGLSADWDYTYSTISPEVRKISQESFLLLYEKGLMYRGYEPALYCTTCRTSFAQAELDHVDLPSLFTTLAFKTIDGKELNIATTRPELLSSCVALFFHPDDERYQYLKNSFVNVPLFGHKVPILSDELVNPQKGTGLVMCCAFGDKTDVHWIKKHQLTYKSCIGSDGKIVQETPLIGGLKVLDARKKILEELEQAGHMVEQKEIVHTVSVHERCKKEIEYVPLSQWYLKVLPFKDTFLALGDKVSWFPDYMKSRYNNWVENLGWDWCLSRQRFYGIPFPVWHCRTCNAILLPKKADLPIDPQETAYPGKTCACGSDDIVPDTDVMDTWATSSLTPYICYYLFTKGNESVFGNEIRQSFLPMTMRPQAHDIIRTWAFYTLAKTYFHHDTIPWNTIVISGHVQTEGKEKLSKSQDQKKLDPHVLLERYSADAIRYWTASAHLGVDVQFSETQISAGQRLITKLWNAFKFIYEHVGTKSIPGQKPEGLDVIDEWLLHGVAQVFKEYKEHFECFEFSGALQAIDTFFWRDFCDNYLEIIKDRLFNPGSYSTHVVQGTYWVLYHVGLRILQMYAAYVPFLTETLFAELYAKTVANSSVHSTKFTQYQDMSTFEHSYVLGQRFVLLVQEIRKYKTAQQLSLKAEIKELTLYSQDKDVLEALKNLEQTIKGVTRAQRCIFVEGSCEKPLVKKDNDTLAITMMFPQ